MNHARALFAAVVALLAIPALMSLIVTAQSNMILKGSVGGGSGAGSCAESTAWFGRAGALDTTHHNAYDNLICGLVSDGVWAKGDAIYVFAAPNTTAANLNLKSSSFSITANGAPNFVPNDGYLGVEASTTVYLNTNYNPVTAAGNFVQDSASVSNWIIGPDVQSTGATIGNYDGTTTVSLSPRFTDNNTYASINTTNNATATGQAASGSWVITRLSSALQTLYHNGASVGTNNTGTTGLNNLNMYILARNDNGVAAGGAGYRVAGSFFGGGLADAEVAAVRTRGCAYLTAIGSSGAC
jgi:hypothetical protein